MYKQCVMIRHEGKTETINLEYERENDQSSDEQFTSESESKSSDSDNQDEDQEQFVMTLSEAYEDPCNPKLCILRTVGKPQGRNDLIHTEEGIKLNHRATLKFLEKVQESPSRNEHLSKRSW